MRERFTPENLTVEVGTHGEHEAWIVRLPRPVQGHWGQPEFGDTEFRLVSTERVNRHAPVTIMLIAEPRLPRPRIYRTDNFEVALADFAEDLDAYEESVLVTEIIGRLQIDGLGLTEGARRFEYDSNAGVGNRWRDDWERLNDQISAVQAELIQAGLL